MESLKLRGLVVGNYELLSLIGMGGTALVFSAKNLKFRDQFGADHTVALKFIFERARAEDEAKRLMKMSGVHGVNDILCCFEADLDNREMMRQLIEAWASKNTLQIKTESTTVFVLVLNLERGDTLTRTRPWSSRDDRVRLKGQWEIESSGKRFVQYLRNQYTYHEKIALIQGMINAIQNSHNLFDQVHGDLHPGNVLFNHQNAEVVIIDWSNEGVFGTDGWTSPWHDQLILNEIYSLPKAADIFLLALWVQRLLGFEHPVWQRFALHYLEEENANLMPTIDEFLQSFNCAINTIDKLRQRRRRWKAGAILALTSVLTFMVVFDWENYFQKSKIDSLLHQNISDKAKMHKLQDILDEAQPYQIRKYITQRIGEISLSSYAEPGDFSGIDVSRPTAVYFSEDQSFVAFRDKVLTSGCAINNHEYIYDIDTVGLVVADMKNHYRFIEFPEHALQKDASGSGCLIIYSSELRDLITALGMVTRHQITFTSTTSPRVFGLLRGANAQDLVKKLFLLMDCPWDASNLVCSYEKHWLKTYEVIPGEFLKGNLIDIFIENIHEKLGYHITDITPYFQPNSSIYPLTLDRQMSNNIKWYVFYSAHRLSFDPCEDSAAITIMY